MSGSSVSQHNLKSFVIEKLVRSVGRMRCELYVLKKEFVNQHRFKIMCMKSIDDEQCQPGVSYYGNFTNLSIPANSETSTVECTGPSTVTQRYTTLDSMSLQKLFTTAIDTRQ